MNDRSETRDLEAERYEDDPSLLEPRPGAEVKKLPSKARRLGGAIPVRFTDDTIERVKQIAEHDGVTVSAWIRSEIEHSLDRREGRILTIATVTEIDPAALESATRWQNQAARYG